MIRHSSFGGNRVLSAALGLLSPRFKILAYHSVAKQSRDPFEISTQMFTQQMQVLSDEGYRVVSLEQGCLEVRTGRIRNKTIVITFDDGFRGLQDHVFPLLEKYQFPATVFVPFDYVGGIDCFSYKQPRPDFEILTHSEMKSSMRSGISYGSHTMSHVDLTQTSDKALNYELNESKKYLNDLLKTKFSPLAYPFGMFDERVKLAATNAGYDCSVCFGNILSNSKYTQLFELKREKILETTELDSFRSLINVSNDLFRKTKNYLKK
ncbi:MAG TPA: polysaccharide deacetylase family protein [Geopsychrobacteraceae bacterium]|nr:polysaccharide deacetylase family protein [Geopsychrobacteraceae bacterium]